MLRSKALPFQLLLATLLTGAASGAQQRSGTPGTLNFVQGHASLDGQPLTLGTAATQNARHLRPGESLATSDGSADILLAPGALLRVGEDATVQMVQADPHRTEVRMDRGLANVSVHQVRQNDLLLVDLPNGQVQLLSGGLYSINVAAATVRVFDGEAWVFPGTDTSADVKPVKIKAGHELVLGEQRTKAESFDRASAEEDLLPWTGPAETRAAVAGSGLRYGDGGSYTGNSAAFYGDAGYGGFAPYGGFGYGYGFGGYGPYGFGSPYYAGVGGYGWGPYGFYGYPFFGVGYGYGFGGGGFYPGGFRGGRVPRFAGGGFGFAGRGTGVAGGSISRAPAGGFRGGSAGMAHGGGGGRR